MGILVLSFLSKQGGSKKCTSRNNDSTQRQSIAMITEFHMAIVPI